jgi:hypothetical protein
MGNYKQLMGDNNMKQDVRKQRISWGMEGFMVFVFLFAVIYGAGGLSDSNIPSRLVLPCALLLSLGLTGALLLLGYMLDAILDWLF